MRPGRIQTRWCDARRGRVWFVAAPRPMVEIPPHVVEFMAVVEFQLRYKILGPSGDLYSDAIEDRELPNYLKRAAVDVTVCSGQLDAADTDPIDYGSDLDFDITPPDGGGIVGVWGVEFRVWGRTTETCRNDGRSLSRTLWTCIYETTVNLTVAVDMEG